MAHAHKYTLGPSLGHTHMLPLSGLSPDNDVGTVVQKYNTVRPVASLPVGGGGRWRPKRGPSRVRGWCVYVCVWGGGRVLL